MLRIITTTIAYYTAHNLQPLDPPPQLMNQCCYFVSGYRVRKGTTIFLNNFDLNRSPDLWKNPEEFSPERFLVDNCLVKPDHFFPFSSGRRSCMGYKIVQLLSFSIISLILQRYRIQPVAGCSYDVPIGDLSLPFDTFKFKFLS